MRLFPGTLSIFIAVFGIENLILIIWRQFQPTSLIVDQCAIVIALVVTLILVNQKFRSSKIENLTNICQKRLHRQVIINSSMFFLIWILLVPGTIERSRSLAIFQWVQYGNTTHKIIDIETSLVKAYNGFDLEGFRLRLHEHEVRKLLNIDSENTVTLTPGGMIIYMSANLFANIYNLKGWYQIPLSPLVKENKN
jgi:hypothetical protein